LPDGKRLTGNAKRDGDAAHMLLLRASDGFGTIQEDQLTGRRDALLRTSSRNARRIRLDLDARNNLDMPKGNWSDPRDYPGCAELYLSNADGTA